MAIKLTYSPKAGALGNVAFGAGQEDLARFMDQLAQRQQQIDIQARSQASREALALRAQNINVAQNRQRLVAAQQAQQAKLQAVQQAAQLKMQENAINRGLKGRQAALLQQGRMGISRAGDEAALQRQNLREGFDREQAAAVRENKLEDQFTGTMGQLGKFIGEAELFDGQEQVFNPFVMDAREQITAINKLAKQRDSQQEPASLGEIMPEITQRMTRLQSMLENGQINKKISPQEKADQSRIVSKTPEGEIIESYTQDPSKGSYMSDGVQEAKRAETDRINSENKRVADELKQAADEEKAAKTAQKEEESARKEQAKAVASYKVDVMKRAITIQKENTRSVDSKTGELSPAMTIEQAKERAIQELNGFGIRDPSVAEDLLSDVPPPADTTQKDVDTSAVSKIADAELLMEVNEIEGGDALLSRVSEVYASLAPGLTEKAKKIAIDALIREKLNRQRALLKRKK